MWASGLEKTHWMQVATTNHHYYLFSWRHDAKTKTIPPGHLFSSHLSFGLSCVCQSCHQGPTPVIFCSAFLMRDEGIIIFPSMRLHYYYPWDPCTTISHAGDICAHTASALPAVPLIIGTCFYIQSQQQIFKLTTRLIHDALWACRSAVVGARHRSTTDVVVQALLEGFPNKQIYIHTSSNRWHDSWQSATTAIDWVSTR